MLMLKSQKFPKTADGETVCLIVASLWVDKGIGEGQGPRCGRGSSSGTPEVAVRASIDGITASVIDVPWVRQGEWEAMESIISSRVASGDGGKGQRVRRQQETYF